MSEELLAIASALRFWSQRSALILRAKCWMRFCQMIRIG